MPHTETPGTGAAPRTRLRWWTELPLIVLVYACYSVGRLLVRGDVTDAVGHGLAILRVEKALHLNAEHPLNRLFTREAWLGVPADFWYASLHYLVTPLVLIWIFRSRAVHYRAARTWLMTSTFIGLIGFTLLPTCPPRLLDAGHGFVDTMAYYSAYGWWGGEASAPRGLGGMTNQYAAMPSLHVGWSLWCGVPALALRPHAYGEGGGRALPAGDHHRGDGHRQPLLPGRGGGRGGDGYGAAADAVRAARRGPGTDGRGGIGSPPGPHPSRGPRAARAPPLSVGDARLPRVSDFHGREKSGPPPPTGPSPADAGETGLRHRLAELRGPEVPAKALDTRALAALAANPGCRRRAILDGAGVDKTALAGAVGRPVGLRQSQFAFMRGNAFEARVKGDGGTELLRLVHDRLDPGAEPPAEAPVFRAAADRAVEFQAMAAAQLADPRRLTG
ncbi:hypothetical protein SFUMM280S_10498 [Streptomyces fumanus]